MPNRTNSLISLATIDVEDTSVFHATDEVSDTQALAQAETSLAAGASALCARCQTFSIQSFAPGLHKRKGYLLRDVELAAAQGCQFCSLLCEALRDVQKPEYFYTNVWVGRTTLNPDLWVHLSVSESYADGARETELMSGLKINRLLVELGDRFSGVRNRSACEVCLAADPDSPAALSNDILGRYIGLDPTSSSHYDSARSWLNACRSHTKCNETVSGSMRIDPFSSPLPTRVIEVTRESGQRRLYLRASEGLRGAYITLTHRWNEFTGKCITTTSNYENRLLGSGFGILPRLFEDAFTVAENLGINYIWIDSICIIQQGDDLEDWRKEAPQMAQYYQFSIFTLAATAENVVSGILQPFSERATPWLSKLVQLPYRDKSGTSAGNFYTYIRRVPLVDEYMEQVRSSILFKRGWILQEWLLSKRILWYTPNGLFFECQEDLPRAYDQSHIVYSRAGSELQAHLRLKVSFHFSNVDILSFWYHALEVYSGQHLTKPELDKILAVAGLAKEVGQILANPMGLPSLQNERENEVYLAGLWLKDIHQGLLWERDHDGDEQDLKYVPKVPSWSWASLLAKVRWPERGKGSKTEAVLRGVCFEERGPHSSPRYLVTTDYRLRSYNGTMADAPIFDPTRMFSCLHMRGQIHTVHIRGYLENEENLKNAAISTAYSPIPKSGNWRAVCSAWKPDIIAGWGSLERWKPRIPEACDDFGIAVQALLVSTRYLRHGVWIKKSTPVLDVLFLEEVLPGNIEHGVQETESNCFRRIGVGRIADEGLITEFEDVEERDFQLV